jgi:hypothetical protein
MDINANLNAMGRYGRAARIGAVVCLLVTCILLLVSLASPSGADTATKNPATTPAIFAH